MRVTAWIACSVVLLWTPLPANTWIEDELPEKEAGPPLGFVIDQKMRPHVLFSSVRPRAAHEFLAEGIKLPAPKLLHAVEVDGKWLQDEVPVSFRDIDAPFLITSWENGRTVAVFQSRVGASSQLLEWNGREWSAAVPLHGVSELLHGEAARVLSDVRFGPGGRIQALVAALGSGDTWFIGDVEGTDERLVSLPGIPTLTPRTAKGEGAYMASFVGASEANPEVLLTRSGTAWCRNAVALFVRNEGNWRLAERFDVQERQKKADASHPRIGVPIAEGDAVAAIGAHERILAVAWSGLRIYEQAADGSWQSSLLDPDAWRNIDVRSLRSGVLRILYERSGPWGQRVEPIRLATRDAAGVWAFEEIDMGVVSARMAEAPDGTLQIASSDLTALSVSSRTSQGWVKQRVYPSRSGEGRLTSLRCAESGQGLFATIQRDDGLHLVTGGPGAWQWRLIDPHGTSARVLWANDERCLLAYWRPSGGHWIFTFALQSGSNLIRHDTGFTASDPNEYHVQLPWCEEMVSSLRGGEFQWPEVLVALTDDCSVLELGMNASRVAHPWYNISRELGLETPRALASLETGYRAESLASVVVANQRMYLASFEPKDASTVSSAPREGRWHAQPLDLPVVGSTTRVALDPRYGMAIAVLADNGDLMAARRDFTDPRRIRYTKVASLTGIPETKHHSPIRESVLNVMLHAEREMVVAVGTPILKEGKWISRLSVYTEKDDGWSERTFEHTGEGSLDPHLASGSDGTLYAAWSVDAVGPVLVSRSPDGIWHSTSEQKAR